VTAFARSDDRRRAIEIGYADYITKPVEGSQLVTAVRDLLSSAHP